MASTIGIFDSSDLTNQLFLLWEKRHQQLENERLQPYADLLLDTIVWPHCLLSKNDIVESLKTTCRTADFKEQLSVPIWYFSHVFDYPRNAYYPGSISHDYALRRGDKAAQKVQFIHEMGLRQYLSVQDEDECPTLQPATIWSIVKKTDFCDQLAARFGRSFTVTLSSQVPVDHELSPDETFCSNAMMLKLNFFPHGLTELQQKKRGDFEEAFADRGRRTLRPGEKLIFWEGERYVH
jgi:hypothetical protein